MRLFNSLLFLIVTLTSVSGQGFIGNAIQAFSPCPNAVLAMTREIGGPPKSENYWDGVVSLANWPDIPEVRIAITLDNPAKIEIVSIKILFKNITMINTSLSIRTRTKVAF